MDLQNTFYLVGIIFMTLSILILLVISIVLYLFVKKITELQKNMKETVEAVVNFTNFPGDLALNVGTTVAKTALKGVGKIINRGEQKSR